MEYVDYFSVCNSSIDVGFVMDSSGYVSDRDWPIGLDFITQVIGTLPIGEGKTRVYNRINIYYSQPSLSLYTTG